MNMLTEGKQGKEAFRAPCARGSPGTGLLRAARPCFSLLVVWGHLVLPICQPYTHHEGPAQCSFRHLPWDQCWTFPSSSKDSCPGLCTWQCLL